jgi:ABC-type protease/lipase transport system fused ATPase/permease subunit
MKLLAVMLYITGGLYAITIIGLVIAWLPIWMGYLLWKSAAGAEAATATGSEADAIESLRRLRTLFTVQGVLALISIGFMLLWILIIFVAVVGSSTN